VSVLLPVPCFGHWLRVSSNYGAPAREHVYLQCDALVSMSKAVKHMLLWTTAPAQLPRDL
jgi:hypothetical protein